MQEQSESINLNILMENAMQPTNSKILFLTKLKFKNAIYSPGDNIALKGGEQELYGKVMLIAKVPGIQFPVLLVNWYFQYKDPIIKQQGFTHLSKKELIFSDYNDWQYVESVKGKIKIITMEAYQKMDGFGKSEQRMFFCRNYILTESPNFLNQLPKRVCLCRTLYNPDETLACCTICGFAFHPRCCQNDELCIRCRYF